MEISTQIREGHGTIAYMVIDNSERLNVLDSALIQSLSSAIASLENDESIRAIVLTGAGDRAFIGGADIGEMSALTPDTARTFITGLHQACEAIRKFPAPVIARIKGYCLGAGLEIAISCDLRIASDDSVFGMPEVKVGIPSVIEAALLPRLVGSGRARQLVLTGEPISAPEALAWGLVEQVAPAENLDAAVDQWIRPILDAGAQAVRIQKALIRDWESLPLEQSVERGIDAFSRAYETEEPASLMQKFLRRRDNR